MACGDEVHRLVDGFPERPRPGSGADLDLMVRTARDLAGHIAASLDEHGRPVYSVDAVTGRRTRDGTGPRQVHALTGLALAGRLLDEPGWEEGATTGLRGYLDDVDPRPGGFAVSTGGALADAVLYAALGDPDHPLHRHPAVTQVGQRGSSYLRWV